MSTTFNAELADEVLAYIKAHPEKWDQRIWAKMTVNCGTAMCVAGATVHLSGAKLLWPSAIEDSIGPMKTELCEVDGEILDIGEYARRMLGLTDDQADYLFDGNNDLKDIERYFKNLKEGKVIYRDDE